MHSAQPQISLVRLFRYHRARKLLMGVSMRRLSAALIAAVSAVAFTQIASAADLPRKAPAPVVAPAPYDPWTGFYVGVSLGGRWSNVDWTSVDFDGNNTPDNLDNPASLDQSSFRAGGYVGYNWKIAPNWLVGIEGDIAWGHSSKTSTPFPGMTVFGAGTGVGTDFITVKLDWDASIRGRVGYLVTPTWLIYATGGVAWQNIEASASCVSTGTSYCGADRSASKSSTQVGWTVGGGLEWAFAPHWLARIEYRYADFNSLSLAFPPAPNAGFHADIDVKNNIALAGLAYKF